MAYRGTGGTCLMAMVPRLDEVPGKSELTYVYGPYYSDGEIQQALVAIQNSLSGGTRLWVREMEGEKRIWLLERKAPQVRRAG